jgi:hypothetical protein
MPKTRQSSRKASKVSDEELQAAVLEAANMRQLLRLLGIAAYGGNYESIRRRLEVQGGVPQRFQPRRYRPGAGVRFEVTDDLLLSAASAAPTKAALLRTLGYNPTPHLYRALNQRLDALGIDAGQFGRRGWSRGLTLPPRTDLADLLCRDSRVGTNYLRRRLLREGVFAHRCVCCGFTEWEGQPVPLELDHIDGDRTNNEIGNLRLVCPNCHALTDTYRGRNVGRPHGVGELKGAAEKEDLRSVALRRLAGIVGAA